MTRDEIIAHLIAFRSWWITGFAGMTVNQARGVIKMTNSTIKQRKELLIKGEK